MFEDEPIGFADLNKLPVPPRYHALLIAADGRVVRLEKLPACDDPDAVQQARSLANGHAVELWDGMRFIEHFPAEQEIAGLGRNYS